MCDDDGTAAGGDGTASGSDGTASGSDGTAAGSDGTAAGSDGTAAGSDGTAAGSDGTAAGSDGTASRSNGTSAGSSGDVRGSYVTTPTSSAADDSAGTAAELPVRRVRMDLAYDGTDFAGFAENRDVRTVAGDLRSALERICGHQIELFVAGRTDRGVHAAAQTVHFDTTASIEPPRLLRSLNKMVFPAIAVASVREVPMDFHARFSATSRRYRYQILASPFPDVFAARTSWWLPMELAVADMETAAEHLIGEHDFSAFCKRPARPDGEIASLVRRVHSTRWSSEPVGASNGGPAVGAMMSFSHRGPGVLSPYGAFDRWNLGRGRTRSPATGRYANDPGIA
jgi:tRNA pseudouridine(38-40) synthase